MGEGWAQETEEPLGSSQRSPEERREGGGREGRSLGGSLPPGLVVPEPPLVAVRKYSCLHGRFYTRIGGKYTQNECPWN